MESLRFGLEIREAWCQKIRSGMKKIELRAYPLLEHMLHQDIAIMSTSGPEGRSLLSDNVEAGAVSVVGSIRFSKVKRYESEDELEDDGALHLVEKGSPYGWTVGATSELYGWVIERTE